VRRTDPASVLSTFAGKPGLTKPRKRTVTETVHPTNNQADPLINAVLTRLEDNQHVGLRVVGCWTE
jgi:hypothetical protein